ncbi:hypothetical protein ACEPAI_1991 [Sanghuangporus weigelae]
MSSHYSLEVIRLEDLRWKRTFHCMDPTLYVALSIGDITERTRTIKRNRSPTWNETITFPASFESETLEIQVIHESILLPDSCVGVGVIDLADLLARSSAEGSDSLQRKSCFTQHNLYLVPLNIVSRKRGAEFMGRILLRLSDIGTMKAADMSIRGAAQAVQRPGIVQSADAPNVVQSIDDVATQTGNQGDLYKAVGELLRRLEGFEKIMDALSEIHPFLSIACSLTSALYKAVKNVFRSDQKIIELVLTMSEAFEFTSDVQTLCDKSVTLQRSIDGLLKQTIECCIFVREYTSHSFVGRMLEADKSQKIDRFIRTLAKLKNDIDSGVNIHTAVVSMRTACGVDKLLLHQYLNPGHFDAFDRPICLPGTRSGIRQHIIEWMFSETTQNVFWLYGVAGSGKSTISSTIAQHFRDMSRLGAFLFFERGKSEPSSVIRTIAYKLGIFDSSIGSSILSAIEDDQDVATASSMHQFNKLLLQPLVASASSMSGPIVIVFDALDECGTPDTRRGLMDLVREFTKLPSIFRFFITSRRESDIDKVLSSQPNHVRAMELDYTSKVSQEDVVIYLRTEMYRAVREEVEIPNGYPWEVKMEMLGNAAGGLFIWASTAVKMVENSNTKLDRLEHLVSDSRTLSGFGLDALYAAVLSVSGIKWSDEGSKELFRKVLALVLLSKVPVSSGDIDGILGLPPQRSSILILQNLRSVLTYNPGGPVSLLHTSFSDYLMSPERSNDLWFIDIPKAKDLIINQCFIVMKNLLRFNICDLKSSFVRNDDVPDLADRIKSQIPSHLEYACLYWAQHLLDASYSSDLHDQLSYFAYRQLLFWFEVLSLLNLFGRVATRSLREVLTWIVPKDASLASFLQDASRLASMFSSPIMQSTPHVYISMLPFWGDDSEFVAHYSKCMASMVRVEHRGVKRPPLCLKVLEGHSGRVSSAAFSPNGMHVASACNDNTVLVRDIDSGDVIYRPLEGRTARFSPDGSRIVSGSKDGTLRVWNARDGSLILGPLEGHTKLVNSVAWSSDGTRIASDSDDKTIIIWDAADGRAIFRLTGHTDWINSVAFSPDSARLASGSEDKTIRIWDVNNGLLAFGPFEHSSEVKSVAYSPDGKQVVSGSVDRTIKVWEVESGSVVSTFKGHTDWVMSAAYSPCGSYIVSGSLDKTIIVWDAKSGNIASGPFEGHTEYVYCVAYSPNGKYIASGSDDRTVRIWDASFKAISSESSQKHTAFIMSLAFSPDGRRIASASVDGSIIVWDAQTGDIVAGPLLGHTKAAICVAFLQDGLRLVSGSSDKTIRIWGAGSYEVVCGPLEGELTGTTCMAVSPDGMTLVFGLIDKAMRVWSIASDSFIAGPSLFHKKLGSIAFSPGGKQFASGSGNMIKVWNTETWKVTSELSIKQSGSLSSVCFSPDDTRIACGTDRGNITILNTGNGHIVARLVEWKDDLVTSILYSHDGGYLITASGIARIRIWNVENHQILCSLEDHLVWMKTLALSLDGSRIVAPSCDNTVRVWDVSDILQHPSEDSRNAAMRSSSTNRDFSDWVLGDNGWIKYGGPKGDDLLLWIPPDLRRTLCGPRNISVLNCDFSTKLDFTGACLGERWTDCFITPEQLQEE